MTSIIRTYTELNKLKTFDERFKYLRLSGVVGVDTFGFDRYLNQNFYRSKEWKEVRDEVILRDNGCDLGVAGYDILNRKIIIHHMNPITTDDLIHGSDYLLNPEYLITTTLITHNDIHYSDEILMPQEPVERKPFDTCPWRV